MRVTVPLRNFPVIYHSLEQVLKTLTTSEVSKRSEVTQLLRIGATQGILDSNTFYPKFKHPSMIKPKLPFIVIEGLDGSGKTKVSTALAERLDLELKGTPPQGIKHLKEFFDSQNESIRRAYYSFGNYLAAQEVLNSKFKRAIIMDRYWHSTAAYALAHELTSLAGKWETTAEDYHWPSDLLKPDLVLFLVVSEEVRRYRHAFRNTTNTKEEQMLAINGIFRQNLIDSYTQIKNVKLIQMDANEDIEIVKQQAYDKVVEAFPILLENVNANHRNPTKNAQTG